MSRTRQIFRWTCEHCGKPCEKLQRGRFCSLSCSSIATNRLRPKLTAEERRLRRCESARKWRQSHPEAVKQDKRRFYQRHRDRLRAKLSPANLARAQHLRQEILRVLGGKCIQCGFDDWRALQVDHVNGGGRKDRRRFANKSAFLRAVMQERDKYQLLCANCNWIKRYEQGEYRWKTDAR